jgi:hypothetical protein
LAVRLDEAVRCLRVELATWWEADAELEALRTSTARVWGLVLGRPDRPSSLAASLFVAAELLEGWSCHRDALPELRTEPKELGSGRIMNLTEDETDAVWTQMHVDSLVSHVPSSFVRNPPDGMRDSCASLCR